MAGCLFHRQETRKDASESEYIMLLHADVDAFLNRHNDDERTSDAMAKVLGEASPTQVGFPLFYA